MPQYVFQCVKCKKNYEDLVLKFDETRKYPDVKCPFCNSVRKKQLPTTPGAIIFTNPRGTSKGDNDSYVYGFNMDQAATERRTAEENSHMGADPYPVFQEDIDSGNYDEPE
jgi:DNA-directed RNA polymerase subunit RPC12/RpoP